MLALLYDYRTNLGHYPRWHEYFREQQPPLLIVWVRTRNFPPLARAPIDLLKASPEGYFEEGVQEWEMSS